MLFGDRGLGTSWVCGDKGPGSSGVVDLSPRP